MIEQGSLEWKLQRVGRVTASRIADVVAKTKTGYGASRANYMAELAAERLTGQPYEQYVTADMKHGSATEPEARTFYEFMRDVKVEVAEFVPIAQWGGASPDGYVGTDGLFEVKCPKTATHIATLLGAATDQAYVDQVQFQMLATGRQWCDWCSYDPRLPPALRLVVRRIQRDDARIGYLADEAAKFLDELDAMVAKLNGLLKAAA